MSESVVVNQLRKEAPKIAEGFDKQFSDQLNQISVEVSRAMSILFFGAVGPTRLSKVQETCLPLLLNASDSSVAALELLRNGHRLQPGILIRNVLESLCAALYLFQLPDEIPLFMKGKLDSAKTVGKAKEAVPILGRLYGYFSNEFAHLGVSHRSFNPLIPFEKKDNSAIVNLAFIRMSVALLYITAELIFLDSISRPRYWRKVATKVYSFSPSEKEWDWLINFLGVSIDKTESALRTS